MKCFVVVVVKYYQYGEDRVFHLLTLVAYFGAAFVEIHVS